MRISDWSSDVCSSDLGKGAGNDAQRLAFAQAGWGKLDQPVRAGARLDLLEDARRHRGGRVGMANQPSQAEGAVDRPPGRLLEIELYKDVARKQRRLHPLAPAPGASFAKLGSAPCRERLCNYVQLPEVPVSLTHKK